MMKLLLLAMLVLLSIVHATPTSVNTTAPTASPTMSPTQTACETYKNNKQCKKDQACGWRGRRKCVLTCKYNAQAACVKDYRCEWNKPKAKKGKGHCRIADDDVRRRLEEMDEEDGYEFTD